jgi:hypothetical protein
MRATYMQAFLPDPTEACMRLFQTYLFGLRVLDELNKFDPDKPNALVRVAPKPMELQGLILTLRTLPEDLGRLECSVRVSLFHTPEAWRCVLHTRSSFLVSIDKVLRFDDAYAEKFRTQTEDHVQDFLWTVECALGVAWSQSERFRQEVKRCVTDYPRQALDDGKIVPLYVNWYYLAAEVPYTVYSPLKSIIEVLVIKCDDSTSTVGISVPDVTDPNATRECQSRIDRAVDRLVDRCNLSQEEALEQLFELSLTPDLRKTLLSI